MDRKKLWLGGAFALLTVTIWASWFIVTRLGVLHAMHAVDVVAARFGTAAIITLPIAIKHGFGIRQIGIWRTAALVFGAGAPYFIVICSGLTLAPAAQGGALTPGVMPLWVLLLGVVFLRERPSRPRQIGLLLILVGALAIVGFEALGGSNERLLGQALLIAAGLMWAIYTVALRGAGVTPIHAVAIVAVWSAILYLPVYVLFLHPSLPSMPFKDVAFHCFYQGVFAGVVAMLTWNRAVALLGASRAAPFAALAPVLALLAAIPFLNEIPTHAEWIGTLLISCGVPLATGALDRKAA
ncbi:DMT family transporter [Roseiterribacter gracilis]|uniref:Membrane protein n=1 Tax=Roseiterribacter gracilis TaxID=2812848 RepID=A0A8S8XE81_9PROT|nr:membrane protein [Rhodospirillales bacterium TMPK1]